MYSPGSGHPARNRLTFQLNQVLRRLRQYRTEGEWISALLDGVSAFAPEAAVFAVTNGSAALLGQVNMALAGDLKFATSSTAAFAAAFESKEPVVALRTPGETGSFLSGAAPGERAHIVPITNGSRVVALLFAAYGDEGSSEAIELIAGMASIVLERRANASLHTRIEDAQITRHLGADS